ncbi:AAA family ATPase [Geomonas nitrogeniifigens]|uniref:ATP-binding protein n=1 Tax=Geomonas diazotrophica TaxID=2843197 RepID=UPI001C2BF84A|nr:AAA family ATPase [Geomonas nitrogeniifigens]QXE84896.1 AAA family ATPase [Geomonas nitrogeniifigens]
MENFTIGSISMKNFKLFGPHGYTVNFADDRLIVFDGPNGYGKTSVFDAIELALTGNISRFHAIETNSSPKDIVVAHNNSADVEVKLELRGTVSLTIIRRIKKPFPKSATKIKNFKDLWSLYRLDGAKEESITDEKLRELLGGTNIGRDFHLFHYVQQEETAHFLKANDEKKRAETITQLFGDTKKEEESLAKVTDLLKKAVAVCKKYESQKEEKEKAYGLSNLKRELANQKAAPYLSLLPWLKERGTSPEWDREMIPLLTLQKRDQIITDLSKIKDLILHQDVFLTDRTYERVLSENELIRGLIVSAKYLEDYEIILERAENKVFLEKVLSKLHVTYLDDLASFIDLDKAFKLVNYRDGIGFTDTLQALRVAIAQNVGNNKLYTELIQYREDLCKKHHEVDGPDRNNCPMCGNVYDTRNSLFDAISKHGDYYKGLLTQDSHRVLSLKDEFEKAFLAPVKALITGFISDLNAPEPELVTEIRKVSGQKLRVIGFVTWLQSQDIEFEDICLDYNPRLRILEVESRVNLLQQRLKAKAPIKSNEYLQANEGASFNTIFEIFFEKDRSKLQSLDLSAVDNKIKYVLDLYYNSVEQQVIEIHQLDDKIQTLKQKQEYLKVIRDTVQAEIRSYQKKLITDIEIPFFLYSGKILQLHQAGLGRGVFIKDPVESEELKNIRLVSNWESEHDILNTMSSGQIAAVVISLTLALNRVYSNQFGTLLVDDPVQTMDDINMVSLVGLLRNEFPKKQVILATHEESVSRYFLYKFLKYGNTVRKVNLMDREEYQLKA